MAAEPAHQATSFIDGRCIARLQLVVLFVITPSLAHAELRDDIGFTRLRQRLGPATPTGLGIAVLQVEGIETTTGEMAYKPNPAHAEFADKTIVAATPDATPSTHATTVGRFFYGNETSVAPAIAAIASYDVMTWIGIDGLGLESNEPPAVETRRIANHSWINDASEDAMAVRHMLRRADHQVDRDGVVLVVAVDNRRDSTMPKLMSSAYNSITVGLANGESSRGPTPEDDGPGRSKPDLVAPATRTSWAAPIVAGCVALLLETAHADPALAGARRPEAIKALLLAGASKEPYDLTGATPDPHDDWRRTTRQPLDLRYGAGRVDIDWSHRILTGGAQRPSSTQLVSMTGWNRTNLRAGQSHLYVFETAAQATPRAVSIAVTWHRQIVDRPGRSYFDALDDPELANVDVRFHTADGFTPNRRVDQSRSIVDNVEYIYQIEPPAGRYMIEVITDRDVEYAVAWRTELKGDFDRDGDVDLSDAMTQSSCFSGPEQNAASGCEGSDLDGDRDVDLSDVVAWLALFTGAR